MSKNGTEEYNKKIQELESLLQNALKKKELSEGVFKPIEKAFKSLQDHLDNPKDLESALQKVEGVFEESDTQNKSVQKTKYLTTIYNFCRISATFYMNKLEDALNKGSSANAMTSSAGMQSNVLLAHAVAQKTKISEKYKSGLAADEIISEGDENQIKEKCEEIYGRFMLPAYLNNERRIPKIKAAYEKFAALVKAGKAPNSDADMSSIKNAYEEFHKMVVAAGKDTGISVLDVDVLTHVYKPGTDEKDDSLYRHYQALARYNYQLFDQLTKKKPLHKMSAEEEQVAASARDAFDKAMEKAIEYFRKTKGNKDAKEPELDILYDISKSTIISDISDEYCEITGRLVLRATIEQSKGYVLDGAPLPYGKMPRALRDLQAPKESQILSQGDSFYHRTQHPANDGVRFQSGEPKEESTERLKRGSGDIGFPNAPAGRRLKRQYEEADLTRGVDPDTFVTTLNGVGGDEVSEGSRSEAPSEEPTKPYNGEETFQEWMKNLAADRVPEGNLAQVRAETKEWQGQPRVKKEEPPAYKGFTQAPADKKWWEGGSTGSEASKGSTAVHKPLVIKLFGVGSDGSRSQRSGGSSQDTSPTGGAITPSGVPESNLSQGSAERSKSRHHRTDSGGRIHNLTGNNADGYSRGSR